MSRAVSVYYFWGELSKTKFQRSRVRSINNGLNRGLHGNLTHDQNKSRFGSPILGSDMNFTGYIQSSYVTYHGNESTPPPVKVALNYSARIPYRKGMPGPSYSWSCFASSASDAVRAFSDLIELKRKSVSSGQALISKFKYLFIPDHMESESTTTQWYRLIPVIMERLDESLIVLSHHLEWSVADMVNALPRKVHFISSLFYIIKALSPHPQPSDWPLESLLVMNNTLHQMGEWLFYDAALMALDRRIRHLKRQDLVVAKAPNFGTDYVDSLIVLEKSLSFELKLYLLRALRKKVTNVSFSVFFLLQSHGVVLSVIGCTE